MGETVCRVLACQACEGSGSPQDEAGEGWGEEGCSLKGGGPTIASVDCSLPEETLDSPRGQFIFGDKVL